MLVAGAGGIIGSRALNFANPGLHADFDSLESALGRLRILERTLRCKNTRIPNVTRFDMSEFVARAGRPRPSRMAFVAALAIASTWNFIHGEQQNGVGLLRLEPALTGVLDEDYDFRVTGIVRSEELAEPTETQLHALQELLSHLLRMLNKLIRLKLRLLESVKRFHEYAMTNRVFHLNHGSHPPDLSSLLAIRITA